MEAAREGMAVHGEAWYAHEQTAARGQRGRVWESEAGANITMTIAFRKLEAFRHQPFLLSAAIALGCVDFVQTKVKEEVKIKWPNDIYVGDRKAGGILIANQFRGLEWTWAVAGMGINVNQQQFSGGSGRPISLAQLTGETYEVVEEAQKLQRHLIEFLENLDTEQLILKYNDLLFKKGESVVLNKDGHEIRCVIQAVTVEGLLIAEGEEEYRFRSGELEWVFE
jgi:BirA family biotin operon repressor/biotin-[acetyl-CoA-carboxylase] ligase